MNIRYVSQDVEWNPIMKNWVEQKVAAPLARYLKTQNFELSMHLKEKRGKPQFELWAVLQTFDGHGNEIVRRRGDEFHALLNEVSSGMRTTIKKSRARRRFLLNPFNLLPIDIRAWGGNSCAF